MLESPGDMGERADVAEVLKAIDKVFGFSEVSIEATRAKKAEERGGFDDKIYLEGLVEA